ncbi:Endonuclease-reverse transcriptase [Operophtera brumata]|uniref:Endonuclease-reverse transcriptase n=1 Tax=Operophtera brumata TaxID=104452 RepID=A0A0L7KMI6_OPEBR|nr:Endonuclease-reverse transcriptase [Operophtera brumata]
MMEDKFLVWEEKHEKLEDRVENQENRIYFLGKQASKINMFLFGTEETEISYESLEENIIKLVDQYFSIKLTYRDVEEVKRLGKKEIRPRPMVVTFSTLGIKIKILKRKGALKDSQYYLKEDYPKYVLEKRKEFQVQLQLEREKGNTSVIKYDKLIILKNITERKLPTSPENNTAPNAERNTQVNKKNKIQLSHSSLNFLANTNTTITKSKKDKKT